MATATGTAAGPAKGLARAAGLGASLTLALIALLAMGEVGRLVGEVSARGTTHPASTLYSVLQTRQAATALRDWSYAACAGVPVRTWLWWVLLFDLPFILGYAGLAFGATRRWPKLGIGRLTVALVVADVVEDTFTAVALAHVPTGPCDNGTYSAGSVVGALSVSTVVKTLVVAAIVVRILWVIVTKDDGHALWRRVTTALGLQRFIVIVVVVLGALLLVSGVPILEQGVDAERAWVLNGDHWLGITWAAWAVLFFAVLAAALRYLASVKAAPMAVQHVAGTYLASRPDLPPEPDDDPPPPPPFLQAFWASLCGSWRWLVAFLVALALVLVAGATPLFSVHLRAALVLPGLLLAIPLVSAFWARMAARPPTYVDSNEVRLLALRIGRALAWSVPAIVLVSLCRAMVGPMMVLSDGDGALCWTVFGSTAVLAVGYVAAVLRGNPSLADLDLAGATGSSLHWVQPQLVGARRLSVEDTRTPGAAASVLPPAVLTVLCAVPLLVWPVTTSRFLSVLGTMALTLLALTGLYATLQILAHLTDAPHVFQIFRIVRTPVITLTILVGVLATLLGAGIAPHRIRPPARSGGDARPTLQAALTTWLSARSSDCIVAAEGTQGVQPMVLVAAEGGGVRAAWWTVDAMAALTSTECGRGSVFLASGVSGGATGLAVMASSTDPYGDMQRIAGPDALAGGIEGLLSRDLLAGSLGVQVRAADGPADVRFPDRAAMMEQSWERQTPGLTKPFPRTGADRIVPWFTVFNSTSVAYTCRALVADVRLTDSTRCDAPGNAVPGAYDLFSAEQCHLGIPTSTASLLAARFPYVTPSGVITSCTKKDRFSDQLIDGGYSENSGIDTVDAALSQLMPAIRAHNEKALTANEPLVVPMVAFLHNTVVAADGRVPRSPAAQPEVLVPPTNLSDSSVLGRPSTLLQRAAVTAADWVPASADDAQASALRAAFTKAVGSQTMTVAPEEVPALSLPLGWTLSQGTRDALDAALDAYLTCTPEGTRSCGQSRTFDTLLRKWDTTMSFPPATE